MGLSGSALAIVFKNQPKGNQPNNAKEENAQIMYHRNKNPTVKLVYISNIDPNTHF